MDASGGGEPERNLTRGERSFQATMAPQPNYVNGTAISSKPRHSNLTMYAIEQLTDCE
jgi:hypothetical protein